MGIASCVAVENEAELQNFDCGISTVNDLVAASFYPHICKQRKVYKILVREAKVGFLSVSVSSISLAHSDAPVADNYEDSPSFGAVKLDYIAVDQKVQKQRIGTTALKYIIQEARELYKFWPVRLLILDAIRERIDWYRALGFEAVSQTELKSDSPTVQMYIDLMPESEKKNLDTYVTHMC